MQSMLRADHSGPAVLNVLPLPHDVDIAILYCGVCHSDLHTGPQRIDRNALPLCART